MAVYKRYKQQRARAHTAFYKYKGYRSKAALQRETAAHLAFAARHLRGRAARSSPLARSCTRLAPGRLCSDLRRDNQSINGCDSAPLTA